MSKRKRLIRDKGLKIKEEQKIKNWEDYHKVQRLLKDYNKSQTVERLKKKEVPKIPKLKKKKVTKSIRNKKKTEYKISNGELQILKYLQSKNICFIQEKEFTDLVNPKTGQRLRFDFYLPEQNICIEFDGKQHFEYSPDFHGKDKEKGLLMLEGQQYRDEVKNKYCFNRHIKLIRIRYSQYNFIEEILSKEGL